MRTFLSNPLGIFKPLGEAGQGMVTGGSEASSGLLGKLGGFFGKAGTGLLNGLQGLGAKLGLGSVGGAAAGGAASAAGTAATTGVTAAAAATWEIWVPIIIIGIFVFAFFYKGISHTSPMGIARSELVVVGATAGGGVIEENPFVGLTKTANPSSLQDPNGDIVYTYSITPKQGTLTNVTVTQEQITIVQESGNRQSTITPPTPPETFDATFTSHPYTFTLDSSMDDAIIVNTITITATDPNGDPQAVTVSATTLIGNPPTGCFIFQPPPFIDNRITAGVWPATLLSWENAAAAQIIGSFSTAGAPTLCSQGTIDIYYAVAGTDVTCGGWYLQGGNIAIDSRSASCTNANALYTLAHEAGHVYTDRNGDTLVAFRQKGLVTWNGSSCSNTPYPFAAEYISSDASCYSESFAEGFSRCIAGLPIDSGWCDWFAANVFNR